MSTITLTDEDGDFITLDPSVRFPGGSFITVRDKHTDEEASVALNQSDSLKVAEAILARAGRKLVPFESIPSASNVSFNEAVLRVAAMQKRTVAFRYQKINGGFIESRRVNPESLVDNGNGLKVVGHDPDRADNYRSYLLSQIKGEVSFA